MNPIIGTCQLCLAPNKELKRSHFVPSFAYKVMRQGNINNPNPVRITEAGAIQTSWQATANVFCKECESLLSKGGEDYVSRVCWRSPGEFRLRASLNSAKPIHVPGPHQTMKVFRSSQITDIDVPKLVYFGASILWRASVWSSLSSNIVRSGLDAETKESFRCFLKGEREFPKNASVFLTVVDKSDSTLPEFGNMVIFPYREELVNNRLYRFSICGLFYQIEISFLDDPVRSQATFFPGDMICLAPWSDIGAIGDSMKLVARTNS